MFDVNINAGPDAGLTLKSPLGAFTKDAFGKVNANQHNGHVCWSKATPASKRKMCREYLEMWCDAAAAGSRHEFETEFGCPPESPAKRPKGGIHSETRIAGSPTAVAASQRMPTCQGDAAAAGSRHESDAESQTADAESQAAVAASGAS